MRVCVNVAKVKDNTRESLIEALATLGEGDADFNGDNGLEYLWDVVWEVNGFKSYDDWEAQGEPEMKYESNLAYLCDKVTEIEDDLKCVSDFFRGWLYHDSYYEDYDYEVSTDADRNITAIALAYVHQEVQHGRNKEYYLR